MLGLPCGVETGVRKLFRVGVPGRSVVGVLTSFDPPGNMLEMKLAMADVDDEVSDLAVKYAEQVW